MTNFMLLTTLAFFSALPQGIFQERPTSQVPEYSETTTENTVFSLPISGATGYATVETLAKSTIDPESHLVFTLNPGESFCILQEMGEYWQIQAQGETAWIPHAFAMVNLPDLVPSMIYDNTNSYGSVLQAMGTEIPGITGEALYDTQSYNPRLETESFAMPILYDSAKRLATAQELAVAQGNTLVIVETYRPFPVQTAIVNGMQEVLAISPDIASSLDEWGLDFYISTGISNHQKGIAVDLSLGKILETQERTTGDFDYWVVTAYEPYEMPTEIHDLNPQAASMAVPISSIMPWERVPLSDTMNEWSILLRDYCVSAGFSPLSSEWWHFNDLLTETHSDNRGNFFLGEIHSTAPIISP